MQKYIWYSSWSLKSGLCRESGPTPLEALLPSWLPHFTAKFLWKLLHLPSHPPNSIPPTRLSINSIQRKTLGETDYKASIIWNPKHFCFWVINTDIMSFKDSDLKDACLPILAPVIDQIWSVVLANPGRHVIGICTVASGVTGDRGVNTAELPLGFHSSAHLPFFCSPISPL